MTQGSRKGRPLGCSGSHNDGLLKRCACSRRRWSECAHPWYFTFGHERQGFFFNLNKRAALPRHARLARSEAERWRDLFRTQIRDGVFGVARTAPPATSSASLDPVSASTVDALTVQQLAERFIASWRLDPTRRSHRVKATEQQLATICRTVVDGRPLGELDVVAVRTSHIEAFRDARRQLLRDAEQRLQDRRRRLAEGAPRIDVEPVAWELPHARQGEIGINRQLEMLRRIFNWAIERDLLDRESPFVKHGRPVVKMAKEAARTRRLADGEEDLLLHHAPPHLADLIVAALDTGMRRGELLHLQWRDVVVEDDLVVFTVRAEHAKTNTGRAVLSGSQRLRAVLERRRVSPDARPLSPTGHVFGNEVGEKVDSLKTSWRTTCRRAGVAGLNFHDLRREALSRMDEAGVSRTAISAQAGHTRATTTDIYLGATLTGRRREAAAYWKQRNDVTVEPHSAALPLADMPSGTTH